jgi:hypothetical protein
MNPKVKERWLAALRSGEYRKAKGQLHRPRRGSYCCLGVLREVVGGPESDEALELGPTSANRAGLEGSEQDRLIALNDSYRGWDKVIEYIEREL